MKILLPVDGSIYTKRMLSYLAAHEDLLGPRHDYVLFTAVTSIPSHASRFLDGAAIETYYTDEAERVLQPLRTFIDQQGWKVRSSHGRGFAPDAIAFVAETEKPDLIVMGSHGHSSLANMVLGSVATGVLARCKAPVLLIR